MREQTHRTSNLVIAGTAGLGALIIAAFSAYMLTGIAQAVVLAVCFAVMGAGLLVSLGEQRRLENETAPQMATVQETASTSRTLTPFPGLEATHS